MASDSNKAEGNNLQSRIENISIAEEIKDNPVDDFKNELTQTDHLNKKLLQAFMNRLDTSQTQHQNSSVGDTCRGDNKDFEEDSNDEVEDSPNSDK